MEHREYKTFGGDYSTTGPMAGQFEYGFSSKYKNPSTGLVMYIFRAYNPETGRFIGRDPIGERGWLNLYGMVNNNTLNWWDWLGLSDNESCPTKIDCEIHIVTGVHGSIIDSTLRNIVDILTLGYGEGGWIDTSTAWQALDAIDENPNVIAASIHTCFGGSYNANLALSGRDPGYGGKA